MPQPEVLLPLSGPSGLLRVFPLSATYIVMSYDVNPGPGRSEILDLLTDEHEEIHGFVRAIITAGRQGGPATAIIDMLDRLETSCRTHFKNEENILRQHREFEVPTHAAAHMRLLEHLRTLRTVVGEGQVFDRALADWFTNLTTHIDRSDRPVLERLRLGTDGGKRLLQRLWKSPRGAELAPNAEL